MLADLQRMFETAYRIEPVPDVRSFVLTDPEIADALAPGADPTAAREALLVRQTSEGLEVSLYLDPDDLEAASSQGATGDLDRLMRVVEGVSHFVLLTWRAQRDLPVSRLELELQAEVDKYLLGMLAEVADADELIEQLFVRARLRPDLEESEARRYRDASDLAHAYCRSLPDRPDEHAMRDLRRFWRYGQRAKVAHIASLAA